MNLYHLKVLYPTSNRYEEHQYFETTLYADGMSFDRISYRFVDNGNIVAVYPAQYTIIERIDFDVNN